jgi:site-specific DNA-methyltransferase (adenine-specific)
VITSPPYYGLRDYGVESQIGLEATPEEYVETIVGVFREVWRVLADYGSVWLNIGDSYAADHAQQRLSLPEGKANYGIQAGTPGSRARDGNGTPAGLKAKDLMLMPARVALALQADGWWVRSEIVWSKANPMPESASDRPTQSHERVLLLTKSGRPSYWTHPFTMELAAKKPKPDYWWFPPPGVEGEPTHERVEGWRRWNVWEGHDYYFDQEAGREPHTSTRWGGPIITQPPTTKYAEATAGGFAGAAEALSRPGREWNAYPTGGRNMRNVWEIVTENFPGAHFATFPQELVRRALVVGCPEWVCRSCGKPKERIVEREFVPQEDVSAERNRDHGSIDESNGWGSAPRGTTKTETVGWSDCGHDDYRRGIVLDPFMGSGTTAFVARRHARHAVGVELSEDYCHLIAERTQQLSLEAAEG